MEEQDYVQLNTLLAKLRAICLKEMCDPNITTSGREQNLKLVRNIDNIRKYAPLKVGEGTISLLK